MITVVSPLPPQDIYTSHEPPLLVDDLLASTRRHQGDVIDMLKAMIHKEHAIYSRPLRYRVASTQGASQELPTMTWRRRICEWIFEVVDHFSFDREVVSVALNYIDRSASLLDESSSSEGVNSKDYQLLAISSLYLAIKLHGETVTQEGFRLKMKISAFEELGRGSFQVAAIEATERRIASLLDWHLNPTTPVQYVVYLVRMLPGWSFDRTPSFEDLATELYDTTKYLTELACFNLFLTFDVDPSIVAYGALTCALEILDSRTPLPKGAYEAFIHTIASINGTWTPFNKDVIKVQQTLREISPITFAEVTPQDPHDISYTESSASISTFAADQDDDDSKSARTTSPNCVGDASLVDSPKRKRLRKEPAEVNPSLHM